MLDAKSIDVRSLNERETIWMAVSGSRRRPWTCWVSCPATSASAAMTSRWRSRGRSGSRSDRWLRIMRASLRTGWPKSATVEFSASRASPCVSSCGSVMVSSLRTFRTGRPTAQQIAVHRRPARRDRVTASRTGDWLSSRSGRCRWLGRSAGWPGARGNRCPPTPPLPVPLRLAVAAYGGEPGLAGAVT